MRLIGRLCAIAVLSVVAPAVAHPAAAAETPIVIWADPSVAPAIRQVLSISADGSDVVVVPKPFGELETQLAAVSSGGAPDLIWLPNSASGSLAARGLIDRLPLGPALRGRFPSRLLDGYRYGFAYYGLPIRYSNVALVINTELVPTPPTSFAMLERKALRLVKDDRADVALALGGDAAMYPLLSGLGAYLFGKNAAGSLDAYNVGVACPAFLANADRIDEWNATRLLSPRLTAEKARTTFLTGRAPFWISGPEAAADLDTVDFSYEVQPVPPIVDEFAAAPLLDVEGLALTSFARERGSSDEAVALVRKVFARADVQAALAAAGGLAPARSDAPVYGRLKEFAKAGAQGVARPNIPQAEALWPVLGSAWASATAGDAAVGARMAFTLAQRAAIVAVG